MTSFTGRRLVSAVLFSQSVWKSQGAIVNYTNPADDFKPTEAHRQAHSISGEDFERNDQYTEAVLISPIVLCALGLISLVVLDILICACRSKIPTVDGHKYAWIGYYLLTIVAAIGVSSFYLGYMYVDHGLGLLRDFLKFMEDTFNILVMDGVVLKFYHRRMDTLCTESACCGSNITSALFQIDRELNHFNDDVVGVVDQSELVVDAVDTYGQYGIMFTLLILCSVFFSMLLFCIFGLCKKRSGVSCAICCSQFTFLVVMIIGAIFMILTSVIGDICYDNPTLTLLEAVPPGNSQTYLQWYSTCGASGSNPLFGYTDLMTSYGNDILEEIDAIRMSTPGCENEVELLRLEIEALSYLDIIELTVYNAACESVQDSWFDAVNDGICGSFFEGVRICWLVSLVSTILIWILQMPASSVSRALLAQEVVVPGGGHGNMHHNGDNQNKHPESEGIKYQQRPVQVELAKDTWAHH